jgi:hypothetical protein
VVGSEMGARIFLDAMGRRDEFRTCEVWVTAVDEIGPLFGGGKIRCVWEEMDFGEMKVFGGTGLTVGRLY